MPNPIRSPFPSPRRLLAPVRRHNESRALLGRVPLLTPAAGLLAGVLTVMGTGCETTPATDDSQTSEAAPADGVNGQAPAVSLDGSAASTGPTSRLEPTSTGDLVIDHAGFRDLGLRWDWSISSAVPAGVSIEEIHADGDIVYLRDSRNVLRVYSANDGGRRWGVEVEDELETFVGLDRIGMGLVMTSQSEVFVYSVDGGNLLRRRSFGQSVGTAPVIAGKLLVFGTPTGELMGFNYAAGGGQKAWGNANQRAAITAKPALMGGYVGAVSQAGDVIFCDASSGQIVSRKEIFGGVGSDPATDGRVMVIAGLDQSLWAFRPDGRLVWRHRTDRPIPYQPVVHDTTLYCELGDRSQVAIEMSSGEVLWKSAGLRGELVLSSDNGLVFWDSATMTLALVNPSSGDVLSSTKLPTASKVFADSLDSGNLYVATRRGVVAKFNLR